MVIVYLHANLILDDNKIYQWGDLFKKSIAEKTDTDMQLITKEDLFDHKEIIEFSGKFKLCGAIVKN